MTGILFGLGLLSAACATAVRTVLSESGKVDPTAHMLPLGSESVQTQPSQGEWKTVTLTSLRQVEDLLDSLEAHGVTGRDVHAIGAGIFVVCWR